MTDDTTKDDEEDVLRAILDEEDLLRAILKAEDNWRVERGLEGLGRLRRCQPDQQMVEDYLRGDVDEVHRRGKEQGWL